MKQRGALMRRAYCGDGLLRYCLGRIFLFNEDGTSRQDSAGRQFVNMLGENKVLAIIVENNEDIFGKQENQDKHRLGSIYEAYLFDVHEQSGMGTCIEFIIKTFDISPGKTSEQIYVAIRNSASEL